METQLGKTEKYTIPPPGGWARPRETCRWLGVCAYLAGRFGIHVSVVRGAALILLIPCAPAAMLIYLGVSAAVPWDDPKPGPTDTENRPLTGGDIAAILFLLGAAIFVHVGVALFIVPKMTYLFQQMGGPIPLPSQRVIDFCNATLAEPVLYGYFSLVVMGAVVGLFMLLDNENTRIGYRTVLLIFIPFLVLVYGMALIVPFYSAGAH